MSHSEMPRPARVLAAILGVVFLVLGAIVLMEDGAGGWRQAVGGGIVIALGLDFVAGAAMGEWPFLAAWFFLP